MSKQISMMKDRNHEEQKIFPAAHHRLRGAELYVFIILLLVLLAAIVVIKKMDYVWTLSLGRHQIHWLTQIMGRTLFEGELPGGGDGPVIFLQISSKYISCNAGRLPAKS